MTRADLRKRDTNRHDVIITNRNRHPELRTLTPMVATSVHNSAVASANSAGKEASVDCGSGAGQSRATCCHGDSGRNSPVKQGSVNNRASTSRSTTGVFVTLSGSAAHLPVGVPRSYLLIRISACHQSRRRPRRPTIMLHNTRRDPRWSASATRPFTPRPCEPSPGFDFADTERLLSSVRCVIVRSRTVVHDR